MCIPILETKEIMHYFEKLLTHLDFLLNECSLNDFLALDFFNISCKLMSWMEHLACYVLIMLFCF